ncbi:tetratricopeptide repeat protein [Fulvivirgaceae bacterium PWU4]|uniref:Tetratricopeptide repeat protein n=1 Tax=Chryseosolibacter histidini TaxID=2782349 RepID=A0AAP2DPB0_9BACT|nr:tetratricopeptide repeat protein [Chryseosolibacter histidini]MBT1700025.1 tetratricopeptide repeat protein [Chryseosolibacter histidini]
MAYYIYYIYNLILIIRKAVFLIPFLLTSLVLSAQNHSEIQLANEYLLKGDKKKAVELYKDLSKSDANVPLIHNNYINLLLDLGGYEEAHAYLKKILRRDPENMQYKLDVGLVYVRSGDLSKADRYLRDIIGEVKSNVQLSKMMSDYLAARSLTEYSILTLNESRSFLGNPYLFCLDLAMLYRIQGQQDKMVQEYLSYVTQSSANIQYVKNVMQALLTKPEELESLERLLYDKVQKNPDVEVYSDLLIWVTMQQKNFYASFIQARAYDKRYKKEGEKSMEVAKVALDNEDYENASKIYRYVIREYSGTSNHLLARLGLIRTREARVKGSFPVNVDSVKTLIDDYHKFIEKYPDNANSLEATRNEALLFANFLDQKDSSIQILNKLILNPRASLYLKSKAKLDLGDIYLIKGEPWESTLLYSQVEKTQKENPVGYEAKLKNAKLSYYKGDFRLSQEHLDILKEATTREIANDAMELSMRIKENIAFDSVGEALKQYAAVELLLYQNKQNEALEKIKNLKQGSVGTVTFSNQTILDDVYWLEANMRMKRGEFDEAIGLLQKILTEYPDDVLSDDAYFLQAEIYERQLKNKAKAMEIYREFLNKYPGSVFAAEARKRFRTLRGDFSGEQEPTIN